MKLLSTLFIFGLLGCATSIPVRSSMSVENAANPVILVQYRMPTAKKFSPSIYFRDSAGKQYRITVPKD
ncbi:MAG: hypothetical protein ABL958_15465, partial [Bdellovibrionia bacterium]